MGNAVERPRNRKTQEKCRQDSLIFHPWFVPAKITYAIYRLLPAQHRFKLRDYFADHGCMRCDEKEGYCAMGLCEKCYTMLHSRIRASMRKRASVTVPKQYGLKHVGDARIARRLLKGFPARMYVSSNRPPNGYKINNPTQAAFIVMNDYVPGD
jgi:hypothetical protein